MLNQVPERFSQLYESASHDVSHAPATKKTLADALHSKATINDESGANKNTCVQSNVLGIIKK